MIKWHRDLQEARYAKSHLGSRIQIWNLGIHAEDIMQQGLNSEMSKMPRQRSLDQQVCVCVCVCVVCGVCDVCYCYGEILNR